MMFCWRTFEGYFADCWRALARVPGVELTVLAQQPRDRSLAPYDKEVLAGLDVRLMPAEQVEDAAVLLNHIRSIRPDVLVFPGWSNPAWRRVAIRRELTHVPIIMAVDTPRKDTMRQRIGRWAYRRYFQRADRVVVAGERAWQLVRYLGVPENRIRRGMYAVDTAPLLPLLHERMQRGAWPHTFLFVGRLLEFKGIPELTEAYDRYRDAVDKPWELLVCGAGPLKSMLTRAGVRHLGFVQPGNMAAVWRDAGALVLPSREEPWGQVLVEAAAAGVPILCTESCGASVEVVRSGFNGLTFPARDPAALTDCLRWVHANLDTLPEMGRRAQGFAAAHDANLWAQRWAAWAGELVRG